MKARIVYNGQEYASAEAMPEDVRREYEAVLAHFADADRDGIPDVMQRGEGDGAGSTIGIQRSSITFNGRTVASAGAIPAFVRRLVGEALAHARPDRRDASHVSGQAAEYAPRDAEASGPALPIVPRESPFDRLDGREHVAASLDRASHLLALFLGALLSVAAVVVLVGAVAIITTMDASSRSQGGRIYVAIAAIAVLGAIDTQAARLVARRSGDVGLFGPSAASRRFALLSMALLVLAAGLLFGLALLLP